MPDSAACSSNALMIDAKEGVSIYLTVINNKYNVFLRVYDSIEAGLASLVATRLELFRSKRFSAEA